MVHARSRGVHLVGQSQVVIAVGRRTGEEEVKDVVVSDVVVREDAVLGGLHVEAEHLRGCGPGPVQDIHELDVTVSGKGLAGEVPFHPVRPLGKTAGVAGERVTLENAEVGHVGLEGVVHHIRRQRVRGLGGDRIGDERSVVHRGVGERDVAVPGGRADHAVGTGVAVHAVHARAVLQALGTTNPAVGLNQAAVAVLTGLCGDRHSTTAASATAVTAVVHADAGAVGHAVGTVPTSTAVGANRAEEANAERIGLDEHGTARAASTTGATGAAALGHRGTGIARTAVGLNGTVHDDAARVNADDTATQPPSDGGMNGAGNSAALTSGLRAVSIG